MAAQRDSEDFLQQKPGFAKIRILDSVRRARLRYFPFLTVRKGLHSALLDSSILGAINEWLQPTSDGALPPIEIQQEMLTFLEEVAC